MAERFAPFATAPNQFAGAGFGDNIDAQPVWFFTAGGLRPAWLVYVVDDDNVNAFEMVIDDATQVVLAKNNPTWFDDIPRGLVFDHSSPQPNPNPGAPMKAAPPIIDRTEQSFAGDPNASPMGWVSSASTVGNNVIVGYNRLGTQYAMPVTASSANGAFDFPLTLGLGAQPLNFSDASTVNLFYWVNRAHDWYYGLGFDEPAGN